MKNSVKRVLSFVSALAMLSTSAMAVSAAESATVGTANAVVANSNTDFEKINADVFVVGSATSKMEQAALNILKDTLGAKAATKDAIVAAVSAMNSDELSAALENTTSAITANAELAAVVKEATDEVSAITKAARESGAEVVISSVYNPLASIKGGAKVAAAVAAAQVYVDEINTNIEAIAKAEGATIAEVEVADVTIDVEAIKAGTVDAASVVADAFEAQAEETKEAINNAPVEAAAVDYVYGDLNNDGSVKAVDLVIMLQVQLGILSNEDAADKGYVVAAGDVDKDGAACDLGDVIKLKLFLLDDIVQDDLGQIEL